MSNFYKYNFLGNTLLLNSNRFIFWEEESALILSDIHFGKISHFRKNGIAIPTDIIKEDLQRLFDAIQFFKPKKVIIVGDLFHSVTNNEHELFSRWRNDFVAIEFILVRGNHDIVSDSWYSTANITVVQNIFIRQNLIFVHQKEDYKETLFDNQFLICGHVHPAVILKGIGKQSLKLNCFYSANKCMLLPAFGKFTGNYIVKPKRTDSVFAIVNNNVIKL